MYKEGKKRQKIQSRHKITGFLPFLDERFIRREFYKDLTPVNFENEDFHIIGTMGSSHKSIIKVSVFPKKLNDLAPSLRNQVEDEDLAEELHGQN